MYRIVEEPLSADAVARAVTVPEAGGVSVFLGVVRNQTAGVQGGKARGYNLRPVRTAASQRRSS